MIAFPSSFICRRGPAKHSLEILETRIAPATFTWIGSGGGAWTTSANWSVSGGTDADGVPDADDDVTINDTAAGALITITGTQAAHSVSVPGDDILSITTGTFTIGIASTVNAIQLVNGTLHASGQLTLTGPTSTLGANSVLQGSFRNEGTLTLTGGAAHLDSATLDNAGTIEQSAGILQFDNTNPTLHNLDTGLYHVTIAAGTDIFFKSSTTADFDNAGTLRRDGANATSLGGIPFNNLGGTIDVVTGTLTLNTTGTLQGGEYDVASGGTLLITQDTLTASGTLTGSGTGKIRFTGAANLVGGTNAKLNFPAGLLEFGDDAFLSGTITNIGALAITDGVVHLNSGTLNNAGTITHSGGRLDFLGTNPTLDNQATGLYKVTLTGDNDFLIHSSSSDQFINEGILRRDGTGEARFAGVPFNNLGGTVDVVTGTLRLNASGGTLQGGEYDVALGSTLLVTGDNLTASGTLTGSGMGKIRFTGANLTGGTNAVLDFPAGLVEFGNLTFLFGTITNTGALTITDGDVELEGATLNNTGVITQTGGRFDFAAVNPTFNNQAGAHYLIEIAGDNDFLGDFSSSEQFNNAGTLQRDGTGSANFAAVTFNNLGGTINVITGSLALNTTGGTLQGGEYDVASGATLLVSGATLTASGTLTGSGPGKIRFTGANLTGGTNAVLNFPAGLVEFGNLTFLFGTITNTGALTITDGDVELEGATLNNTGVITQTGGRFDFAAVNPTFNNQAGAHYLIEIAGDNDFLGDFSSSEQFNNAGTLQRDGTGSANFAAVTFNNLGGTINVITGSLALNTTGGTLQGGEYDVASGATLLVSGATLTASGTLTGSGPGKIRFTGANLTGGTNAVLNFPAGLVEFGNNTFLFGTITNTGALAITDGDVQLEGATLNNTGTITQTGGRFDFAALNPTFNNQAGAHYLIEIAGDNDFLGDFSSSEQFNNAGVLQRDGTGFARFAAVTFNNLNGTVDVASGSLLLNSTGTLQGGEYDVAAGSTLQASNCNLTASGTLTGSGPGKIRFTGGAVLMGGTNAVLNFPAGLLEFGNDTNLFGTITNANALAITDGDVQLQGATLNNAGIITQSGGRFDFAGLNPTFNNETGALYRVDIAGDHDFLGDFSNTEQFNNAGVLQRDGTGFAYFAGATFNNQNGTVYVASGSLLLNTNGTLQAGEYDVAAGSTLQGTSCNLTATGTLTGQGAGTFIFTGGALLVGGPGAKLNFPAGLFQLGEDSFLAGTFTNTGFVTMPAGNPNTHLNDGAVFNNAGTYIQDSGALRLDGASTFNNLATGIFEVNHPAPTAHNEFVVGSASAHFNNAGLVRRNGTGTFSSTNVIFSNTGTIEELSGGLTMTGLAQVNGSFLTGGTYDIHDGALLDLPGVGITTNQAHVILHGSGSLDGIGATLTTNAGTLELLDGASLALTGGFTNFGSLVLGPNSSLTAPTFAQTSTGRVEFQIGGTPASGAFGQLVSTGAASLAGTAVLTTVNGYAPVSGQTYALATFTSHTGDFSAIQGTYLQRTLIFDPTLDTTFFKVNAVANPSDLAVTAVTATGGHLSGQTVTINYTVANPSAVDATASGWTDSVYLSSDGTYDSSDLLIGRVTHAGGLTAGNSYMGSLTGLLPGVLPGGYQFLVVADSKGESPDLNRANNTGASSTYVTDVPAITPGQHAVGTIASGQDLYFKVNLPAGQNPVFKTTFGANGGAELYVAQSAVPTRTVYDAAQYQAAANSESITGSAPLAGTYYVLLHGREGAGAGTSYDLLADSLGFAITSVDNNAGANVGTVTATIHGSLFTPGTTFTLDNGTTTVSASKVYFQDASTAYATFNLSGAATGNYNVVAHTGAAATTLANGFHVTTGSAGHFTFDLSSPRYVRPPFGGVEVTLTYQNTGNTDLAAPVVTITGTNALLQDSGEFGFTDGSIEVLAISPTGPAGILPPGASGTLNIDFQPEIVIAHNHSSFIARVAGPDDLSIDWSLMKDDLRPAGMAADAWDAIYPNFISQVGSSYGQFQAVMDDNANYLSTIGHRTGDIGELLGYELLQAGDFGTIAKRYELGTLGRGHTSPFDVRAITEPVQTLPPGVSISAPPVVVPNLNAASAVFGAGQAFGVTAATAATELAAPQAPPTFSIDQVAGATGNVIIQIGDDIRSFISIDDGHGTNTGQFIGVPGETGTLLRLPSGELQLTEKDGFKTVFRAGDGKLEYTEDTNGQRVTAAYNADGLLATLTESDGDATAFTYNSAGRLTAYTDAVGRATTFTYDGSNEHLLTQTNSSGTTAFAYTSGTGATAHAISEISYPDGTHQFFSYDASGRLSQQSLDGANQQVLNYTYDSAGTLTETDSQGHSTSIYRDQNAQAARIVDPLGQISSATFDPSGTLLGVTSPGGFTNFVLYDASGQMDGLINPAGEHLALDFSGPQHRLSSLTDALGHTTTFGHDASGNITSITDTAGGVLSYGRDSAGHLTEYVNERGQVLSYTYDAHGLMLSKDLPGTVDDATFTYDAHRNLLTATDGNGTTTYGYDSADRVTKVTYPDGQFVAITYNGSGQRTSIADQDGFTITYSYDQFGRLDKVTQLGSGGSNVVLDDYDYNALGQLALETHGNGTTTSYTYDALGRTTIISQKAPGGAVIESFTYTYDSAGRIASQASSIDGTTTYQYDARGELTGVQTPTRTISYAYDAEGNRTVVNDTGAGNVSYATNDLNEYTSAGAMAYSYDADGNLVGKLNGPNGPETYTYDAENRLIGAVTADGTFTYIYDAAGNRIGMTKNGVRTDLLVDPTSGGTIFAEYTGGTLTAHFAEGLGLTSRVAADGSDDYYHFDLSGNTQLITGAGGTVANTYQYLPFGEKIGSTGSLDNPFTYKAQGGAAENGIGMYDMGARQYDPTLGRFVQHDPIGALSGETNLYRYAINSPVGYGDPSGLILPALGGIASAASTTIGALSGGLSLSFAGTPTAAAGSTGLIGSLGSFGSSTATVTAGASTTAGTAITTGSFDAALSGVTTYSGGFSTAALGSGSTPAASLASNSFSAISTGGRGATYLGAGDLVAPALLSAGIGWGIGTGIDHLTEYTNPDAKDDFRQSLSDQFNLSPQPDQPLVDKSGLNNGRAHNLQRKSLQDPLINAVAKDLIKNGEDPQQALDDARRLVNNYRRDNPPPGSPNPDSETILPHDPNNIIGPNGVGADPLLDTQSQMTRFDGYVKDQGTFAYTVQFENSPTASAPAQQIVITETLDPNLDLSTFQLGDAGFGSFRVSIPAGLDHYSTTIDLTSTLGVLVDFSAALNPVTRVVTWTLASRDPLTGDLPTDPFAGLLPPNVTAPEGDGYVTYHVSPKTGLNSGDQIGASASVVFDTEAPILTPVIHNTIDATAPVSSISAAGATSTRGAFLVNVTAADEAGGSGLANTSVYYTDNGGPLQILAAEATASSLLFSGGVIGHSYAFYSAASDRAGNVEAIGNTPDATVTVVAPTLLTASKNTKTLVDSDGDIYTIKLTGHGTLQYATVDPDGAGPLDGPLDFLVANGTDSKSVLSVTVKHKGDGFVSIGDVEINGSLGKFLAGASDLTMGGLIATGAVSSITLHDLHNAGIPLPTPSITTGGTATNKLSISAHHFDEGFDVTTTSQLSSLRVADTGHGNVQAAAIGALVSTTGALDFDLTTAGAVSSITAKTSAAGTWNALRFGSLTTHAGGLDATITAQSIGNVSVTGGDLDGSLTSTATPAILGRTAAIGNVTVHGGDFDASLTANGKVKALSALADRHHAGGDFQSLAISAGSITSIHAAGALDALTLSVSGSVGAVSAGSEVGGAQWTIGSLKSLSAGAGINGTVTSAGAVGPVTVRHGDLGAALSATNIGAIKVIGGDFTGSVFASAAVSKKSALASLTVSGGDLEGVVRVIGAAGKISVANDHSGNGGNITGATVTAARIAAIVARKDVSDSLILAGADLGTDDLLGGTGSAADSFAAGSIAAVQIGGNVVSTTIAAGLDPTDGQLHNGDDAIIGGTASSIGSLTVTGTADASDYFATGKFTKKLVIHGSPVDPTTDPRFFV